MENDRYEKVCAIALGKIFGYEPQLISKLIDKTGSASAVFRLDRDGLDSLFGPMSPNKNKIDARILEEAERELNTVEKMGYSYLPCTSPDFPTLLREIPDYPAGLYVRSGDKFPEIFNSGPAVSIVGTRDISSYGQEWCPKLVEALSWAKEKPTIVSGLAIGVDICAHMAALQYGLPTIAVIPTGIDDIYPRRHSVIAGKIAESPRCAVITDYPLRTATLPVNFLRRNRIIAGLSQGTILIESKVQGGGTMTARLAAGYGRELMVLPGRIDDPRSNGCNLLLHEKIASPIYSADSLIDDLGLGLFNRRKTLEFLDEIEAFYSKDPKKDFLLEVAKAVKNGRCLTSDDLCRIYEFDFPKLSAALRRLESDGFVSLDLLGRCHICQRRN